MKVKGIIKKQTTIIALAVVLVVVATIGTSYSIFFKVGTNADSKQTITAGSLQMTVNSLSTSSNAISLSSATTAAGATTKSYTIKNTGSLKAKYSIYVYDNGTNSNLLSKIKVGNANGSSADKLLTSYTKKTVSVNGANKEAYVIETDQTINSNQTLTKYIRVYVDESLLTSSVSSQVIKLNLFLTSDPTS